MVSIGVRNLTKRFGETLALDDVSLTIERGELFFLLGASGCGKTTLLRTIAGFYTPAKGRILFDDADVTRTPPHQRNTAMMFQSYALWPHMTVAQNVAFGLEERQTPKPEIEERVEKALAMVKMVRQANRKINQLSGGQQQRVALARALVVRPRCLLLDEPLSNLDAKLRLEMREEIRRLCKEFELTAVYVTHDQKEALSMADRLAVMQNGRVCQVGTPTDVYRNPATAGVAEFIGETNFIDGTILGAEGKPELGRHRVHTTFGDFVGRVTSPEGNWIAGTPVRLSIRPECFKLGTHRNPPKENLVRGKISEFTYLGEIAQYTLATSSVPEAIQISELNPTHLDRQSDAEIDATVKPEDVVILPN